MFILVPSLCALQVPCPLCAWVKVPGAVVWCRVWLCERKVSTLASSCGHTSQASDSTDVASDETKFDQHTFERIRSLDQAKQRAVEVEDYEEAKRCKEMLNRLKQTAVLLRDLEERKKAAVQNEDYDAAKGLKVEIDKLRKQIENPQVEGRGC